MDSRERRWQLSKISDACDIFHPSTVLEVGYPYGRDEFLELWGPAAEVVTIDPYVDEATFKVGFEAWAPDKIRDLVNLTAVLDYFDDPIAGLRNAKNCGNVILLQGRLNTYKHPVFKTKYWAPTKEWVTRRCCEELGLCDVEWVEFFEDQMFSVCGEIE